MQPQSPVAASALAAFRQLSKKAAALLWKQIQSRSVKRSPFRVQNPLR